MFDLDLRSRKPIYEQLIEKMKEMIIHDVLKPNEQLPSVRLLAKQLTINPNTIQKAYRELEREGYIYSIPGKGSFVANKKEAIYDEKVKQLEESIFKLCQEAFYIGVKKEHIFSIVERAQSTMRGGEELDSN
ncbi:GntR family transcriptional regulator [Anoxybacillus gonensis]|uniref:GntR family transcriptional regulator n=1 Tax=Anoxybacillus gonensis TaxID=198467 RepID=A0AAW7TIL9_9BACL|nr:MULTISPECIES: GntR family transcriptional regulator [Anoxybacillus]AKS38404.1 GntR family transcriptional regulator [Anoxybacillus gonensis]KGP60427.1 GntR family transcriptional regulator [Anoxybacillus gonensis]MBW7651737.1 GntR family transcriptional regulator [Anoxybacillus sp. ST4]MCX8047052.1 GntR family transcriptional regulator [Anoxybacillus gonensis]MDO0877776.1 GntR family transcriptional regulator [Anoxybacillus gonensis]